MSVKFWERDFHPIIKAERLDVDQVFRYNFVGSSLEKGTKRQGSLHDLLTGKACSFSVFIELYPI